MLTVFSDDQSVSPTPSNSTLSSTSSSATPSTSGTRKRKMIENCAERRHREKLQRQDRFLGILETLANNMTKSKDCNCSHDKNGH